MRHTLPAISLLSLVLMLHGGVVLAQDVTITDPIHAELVEGQTYSLVWLAGGAETVDISIVGTRTPLGKKPRGTLEIPLAKKIEAAQSEIRITLPWMDCLQFAVRVTSYDGAGKVVAEGKKGFRFRPAVMEKLLDDGIYVDLHTKTDQRLYVQKAKLLTHVYLVSSSSKYDFLPADQSSNKPHDHAGVFKILSKSPSVWSRQYDVAMPWAMRYSSGHFIHATSTRYYKNLGRPASHGCNRLTREDAKALYDITPIGARVEIIGPKG